MLEKFKNLSRKEQVCYVTGILLILSVFLIKIPITKILLVLAGIWILPVTQYLLHNFNIYIADIIIYVITAVCVVLAIILNMLTQNPTIETVHKHTVSNWVYDKETGLEYKKCEECGEIFEKRVPDIVYSTPDPNVTKNPYINEEDKKENTEEIDEPTTTNEIKETEKPTEDPNEGEKKYDDSEIYDRIEEKTKD